MRVILAPMQGVLDPFLRHLLTQVNQYDLCVSEFVRVVDQLLPHKVFYRLCPELENQGKTSSGTPVRIQLLGQHPNWLAENANRAIDLGSQGIDFNCGCPSKTVNGSCGGAALLKQPELIYQATRALRQAVPKEQVVSVKVRLGWDNIHQALEIADAVQQGGANEIVVHGRTKVDGYRAERINWEKIAQIKRKLQIDVIANGEIWDWQSAQTCLEVTQADGLMVARGALNIPNLSTVIKYNKSKMAWHQVLTLLQQYAHTENQFDTGFYHVARIKQWLGYLKQEYPQATMLFELIKTCHNGQELRTKIDGVCYELSMDLF